MPGHPLARPQPGPAPARCRWLLLLAATLAPVLPLLGAAPVAAEPPNIVFVLADDLDAGSIAGMTSVEALAREGASFTRAIVTSPLCSPSRASTLTGRYPQNTGVRRNKPPFGGFESFHESGLEADTVAVWLRRAGYRTGLIGKYLNQYPNRAPNLYIPPGWDYWVSPRGGNYLNRYFDYFLNENGRSTYHGNDPDDYVAEVYTGKALEFIRGSGTRPFALFLWLPPPHTPEVPAPRYADLYPNARMPRLPSLQEADVSDKPSFLRFPPHTPAEITAFDARFRNRVRMLRSTDDTLAAIRAELQARGALANTYIVFTSDNGWHQAYHNLVPWKGTAYDEDLRVPLIVRGPGVPAGRSVTRLVSNADLAPTFAAWAGASAPAGIDGRSFARLLTAADPAGVPWRKRLPFYRLTDSGVDPATSFASYPLIAGQTTGYRCLSQVPAWAESGIDPVNLPEFRGVRTERFTYAEYATGDLELYDHQFDPNELRNGICRASAAFRADLRATAARLATCKGAACRETENR